MEKNIHHIARIVVEAETPLNISCGYGNFVCNSIVTIDVNGLPYIPGTALAGVIRSAIPDKNLAKAIFGHATRTDGYGSNVIFTDAKMIGENGVAIDGTTQIDWNSKFYSYFSELPIRQHVKINDRGVVDDRSKFDRQIVYKGTRFCFEMELVPSDNMPNENILEKLFDILSMDVIRFGGGTRDGFGKLTIIKDLCKYYSYDFNDVNELNKYIAKSSNLAAPLPKEFKLFDNREKLAPNNIKYDLFLKPLNLILFGSGFPDEDSDMTPVFEHYITWNDNIPSFVNNALLIPATSIKGALSHRVAYHYNKNHQWYSGNPKAKTGKENNAVFQLFGSEGNEENGKISNQKRGNLIFSDIIQTVDPNSEKTIQHVSIDRFTGGAIDGALFSEKTIYAEDKLFSTTIILTDFEYDDKKEKDAIINAFEKSLFDICESLLPLGGGVNRGNGMFRGKLLRNNEVVIDNLTNNEYEN